MNLWKNLISGKNRFIIRNRIMASALVAILGFGCVPTVYASAISDAQNKKDQAQSDLNEQNERIDALQGQKDSLQSEIDALDAELVGIIANMMILEDELGAKEEQLVKLDGELTAAKEDERTQYENMKKRIRYMYENGNSSFLEIILGAKDFADFLNRIEYAGQVYGHDRELLSNYQETIRLVADLKIQVEGEKAELEQMYEAYEEQQQEYQSQLEAKRSTMSDFDTQLFAAQQLATQYTQVIAEQQELIRQEEERQRKEEEERVRKEEEQKRKEEEEQRRKQEAEQKQKQEQEEKEKNNSNSNSNNDSNSNNNSNSDTGTGTGGGDTGQSSESTTESKDQNKNPDYATNVSGASVVDYACQFIGNSYVYGGISLTDGCDCSGFVMSVYDNFGISLPHSSFELQSCGKEVSYKNAKPGDLVCYAGHVGIYMGDGQIVHASSSAPYPVGGIKTNNATYRQILTVRRVL